MHDRGGHVAPEVLLEYLPRRWRVPVHFGKQTESEIVAVGFQQTKT
jgi:hypothetical protein